MLQFYDVFVEYFFEKNRTFPGRENEPGSARLALLQPLATEER